MMQMSGVEEAGQARQGLASHLHDNDLLRWTMAEVDSQSDISILSSFYLQKTEAELEVKLKQYLQWRKRRGVDLLLDCWKPPEVLRKYFPGLEIFNIQKYFNSTNYFRRSGWV